MNPERILIVRLGSMGDIIHTLPAAAALRMAFPQATIGWVVEQRWSELLAAKTRAETRDRSPARPLVDTLHLVDTKEWRRNALARATWPEVQGAIRRLRHSRYDVAVDFQGAAKSGLIAQLSGAPRRLGFSRPREIWARLFYTRTVDATLPHVVEQNLQLAQSLAPNAVSHNAFPLPKDPAAEAWADDEICERGLRDGFAILNPGAGWGAKCWPMERYAEVATLLRAEGYRSVVNYGPGEEDLARSVETLSGDAAIALQLTLGKLIALTRRAALFIGGDTGPMHLAAALGVPVVAIFGPTDPARNGPFTCNAVVLRSPESATSHSRRADPEQGLLRITVADVIAGARQLLSKDEAIAPEGAGV